METPKVFESEYRFLTLLWDNEPIKSGALVDLAGSALGWKPIKKVENTNKMNAVICSYGSIGTGINTLLKSDYADEFVVVEGMLRYNLVVDPYSGGN